MSSHIFLSDGASVNMFFANSDISDVATKLDGSFNPVSMTLNRDGATNKPLTVTVLDNTAVSLGRFNVLDLSLQDSDVVAADLNINPIVDVEDDLLPLVGYINLRDFDSAVVNLVHAINSFPSLSALEDSGFWDKISRLPKLFISFIWKEMSPRDLKFEFADLVIFADRLSIIVSDNGLDHLGFNIYPVVHTVVDTGTRFLERAPWNEWQALMSSTPDTNSGRFFNLDLMMWVRKDESSLSDTDYETTTHLIKFVEDTSLTPVSTVQDQQWVLLPVSSDDIALRVTVSAKEFGLTLVEDDTIPLLVKGHVSETRKTKSKANNAKFLASIVEVRSNGNVYRLATDHEVLVTKEVAVNYDLFPSAMVPKIGSFSVSSKGVAWRDGPLWMVYIVSADEWRLYIPEVKTPFSVLKNITVAI